MNFKVDISFENPYTGEISPKIGDLRRNDGYVEMRAISPNAKLKENFRDQESYARHELSQGFTPNVIMMESSFNMSGVVYNNIVKEPLATPSLKPGFQSTKNFIIGAIWLLTLMCCNATTGPVTLTLKSSHVILKAWWRAQGAALLACWMAGIYLLTCKDPKQALKDIKANIHNYLMIGFLQFVWNAIFITSVSMTITAHAQILWNNSGLFFLIMAIATGKFIHKYEKFGYAMFFVGIYFLLTDPKAKKVGEGNQLMGDLLAFIGGGVFWLILIAGSRLTAVINPILSVALSFSITASSQILILPNFIGYRQFYSFDSYTGGFGWLSDFNTVLYILLLVAPLTAILGSFSYFNALYYFPREIISGVYLVIPFVSQTVSILLGQDLLPGPQSVVAGVLITVGLVLSMIGEKRKTNQIIEEAKDEDFEIIISEISDFDWDSPKDKTQPLLK